MVANKFTPFPNGSVTPQRVFDASKPAKSYLSHMYLCATESREEEEHVAPAKSIHPILFSPPSPHVFIVARRINEPRSLVIYDKQMYPARVRLARRDDPICVSFSRRASTPAFSGVPFFPFGFSASFVSRSRSVARGENSALKTKDSADADIAEIARTRACV